MLKVDGISVCLNNKSILHDVSFQVAEHDIFMILGPNGAGKTTLIKAIMGRVKHDGTAYLNGKNIAETAPKEVARQIGVLTQTYSQQFSFQASEVVRLGRYAHQKSRFSQMSREDIEKVGEALKLTGTYHLRNRSILTLSGGELQRIFLAQVFAQDPNILILDEPTNHLDLKYQINLFETLRKWVQGRNRAVISVVHDLNAAYAYGTKALLMKNGHVSAYGKVKEVLNRQNLQDAYDVDVVSWMRNLLKRWN